MVDLRRRRALIQILGSLSAVAGAAPLHAALDEETRLTLSAFVDVLLPADPHSPAASAFGTAETLLELGLEQPLFARLLDVGCNWLNQTGGPPFRKLAEDQKILVTDWMSKADFNEIPRRFYHLVRLVAIEHYFSHAGAIAGLPLNSSPQPIGYPPPWD